MTTLKEWLKEQYEDYIEMREIVVADRGSSQLATRFDAKAAMCERIINKLNAATFDDYAVLEVGDVIIRGGTHQSDKETN